MIYVIKQGEHREEQDFYEVAKDRAEDLAMEHPGEKSYLFLGEKLISDFIVPK